jgi:alkylation response protein AidB-like acyl-CoA dehydrogenase
MDLMPTADQHAIRATVRDFVAGELPRERARAVMEGDRDVLLRAWHKAAELGFFGLGLAEAEGGAGYGLAEEMVLFEELGRGLVPGPWLGTVIAAHALAGDSDPLRRRALGGILAGDVRVGLVERRGRAPLEVFEERLTGERTAVADAVHANALLVLDEVGLLFVPIDGKAVTVDARPSLDPTRPVARVTFADARCDVLTTDPTITAALARAATVLACAEAVGAIDRTLEMSVDHAKVRRQFDRPIGAFQAVKHRCADMAVRAEAARAAATYAVVSVRDGTPDESFQVSVAKIACARAFLDNAADNVQNHGGMGFTWECDAHLFAKRARSFDLSFGTRTTHLDRLVESFRAR